MLKGLSNKEVLRLRKKFGANALTAGKRFSPLIIFLSQFKSPLIYILLFAGAVSVYFGEVFDMLLILVVVVVNVIMGFYQEYSAEKTLASLRDILKPHALVIRNGKREEIEATDIVPGDIVVLGSGDRIPADGKLIEGVYLLVSEAPLTGEEEAIEKKVGKNADQLFMGTTVLAGTGIMRVEKIGSETKIGEIGKSLAGIKEGMTPIQKNLAQLARQLAIFVVAIAAILFLVGVFAYKYNFWEMLELSSVLVVAIIPAALPLVITIILAVGMRRILKRRGLVKKLLAIETLGSTSVICVDKTGTLTEGKMRVVETDFTDKKNAFIALTLTNTQRTNLETALWNYLIENEKADPQKIYDSAPKIFDEPFDSGKKYALTGNKVDGSDQAFILGASEIVLNFCELSSGEKKKILKKIDDWAGRGLRVLGVAMKTEGKLKEPTGFTWLGLVGIEDPVRSGAKHAIQDAISFGVDVKIISGDYRKTVERVAIELGFEIKPENVVEGAELEKMSSRELKKRIDDLILFSRVTPHQKMRIIQALQDKGEIVAMTGDGVNDAPALKKADIGVAVSNATEVAKEASDLILLDNNFKTITAACEEGRLVFSNIKKVVGYILSNEFAEIVLIFGALILGLPIPLSVVQLLWIHLICDGPTDIFLSFEPKEKDLMKEPASEFNKRKIMDWQIRFLILAISFVVGLGALIAFRYYYKTTGDLELARTVAFTIIASASLIYVFSFKNLKKSLIRGTDFFSNKYLFVGVLYGFALVLIAIYLPILNKILGTVQLSWIHWGLVFGVGLLAIGVAEFSKILRFLISKK